MLRPGRFDRILYVGPPDQLAREEILRIRVKKMSVGTGVDVEEINSDDPVGLGGEELSPGSAEVGEQ